MKTAASAQAKTAIIFASKKGATEKCANILVEKIDNDAKLINLKTEKNPEIDGFDAVIIGGPIYMGTLDKRVTKFVERNKAALLSKKLGLYICCMEDGEVRMQQFESAYDEELRNHAVAHGQFGGAFDFKKMNFIVRSMIRMAAKVKESTENFDYTNIDTFVAAFTK